MIPDQPHPRRRAPSRRQLLQWAAGGSAAAASLQALGTAGLLRAVRGGGPEDYKALVVMYLAGGNDSFNMLVPTSAQAYAEYAASRQNLAVPLNDLVPIAPATPDQNSYGLHPALTNIRERFDSNKLAFVANVGSLVRPVTRSEYLDRTAVLPPLLFSHKHQQAQTMQVDAGDDDALGWGGRFGDTLRQMNGGSPLSPGISIAGSTPLLTGDPTQGYHLRSSGSVALTGFTGAGGPALRATFDDLRQRSHSNLLHEEFAQTRNESIELDALVTAALATGSPLQTDFSEGGPVAGQLRMVARMMQVRSALEMQRQVFFVRMGGFDTHGGQIGDQPTLFHNIDVAIRAFHEAMEELGLENKVTLAVISEFGRTLSSNGQGTDHGWGGHYLVSGGAVAGGDIYGSMPRFVLDGPDDSGRGRIIPTTATDQFTATLGRWFGIPDLDLPQILPNLNQFAAADLGFLG